MIRRNFFKNLTLAGLGVILPYSKTNAFELSANHIDDNRDYWIKTMVKIGRPVLEALSQEKLKASMPVEINPQSNHDRSRVTHLEAFGRLMAGMAPWLALGPGMDKEGKLRKEFIDLSLKSLAISVNPSSPDYMNFTSNGQPLVDAAFLCHGILRAPEQLWEKLPKKGQENLITAIKSTRKITPGYNNWLLFSAMIEVFLLEFTGEYDEMRVDLAVKKHLEWYLGDGVYGDGPHFHWDYYNSYVIQPMLLDIVTILKKHNKRNGDKYELILKRARRYAAILEGLIAPEGTFPAIGRSLCYRFGAFQILAQMALIKQLPDTVSPAQVRSALTAVITKTIETKGTFDTNGWLNLGVCGHQPNIAEGYISTGSLYLCSVGMLPLGLPATDKFWAAPSEDWTAKKIWSGKNISINQIP